MRFPSAGFWTYPKSLQNEGVAAMPSTSYTLRVSGDDLEHYTEGDDWQYGPSLRVVAVAKLVQRIQQMIEAKDAYKALPEPRGGYA